MYLIFSDFRAQIQSDNLKQVIGSDLSILDKAELTAIEEATSYLTQKYLLSQEFTPLLTYNPTTIYKVNQRFYLDAIGFAFGVPNTVGDPIIYNNNYYICTRSTTSATFELTAWLLIGPQYSIYNAIYPFPNFDNTKYYYANDKVFWNGKIYICHSSSYKISHADRLQNGSIIDKVFNNAFPDQPYQTQWIVIAPYSVPAGTLPTNPVYFTLGDNRSQQLLTYIVDMALYHVHSRIAPRNIPELRVKRYDDSISWLKKAADGKITANLPIIQPKSGGRIRFGGNSKNSNSY